MAQTQSKAFAGVTFSVTPLPGRRSLYLFTRLGKALGVPIVHFMAAKEGDNNEPLVAAVSELFNRLPKAELESLLADILEATTVGPRRQNGNDSPGAMAIDVIDEVFCGPTFFEIFKLLAYVLEVTYGPLPDVFRGLARAGMGEMAANPFGFRKTSTPRGQSGDSSSSASPA